MEGVQGTSGSLDSQGGSGSGSLDSQDGNGNRFPDEQGESCDRSMDEPAGLDHQQVPDVALDDADLPTSIYVTNLELAVFEDPQQKALFERTFAAYDAAAWFQYFPSFRRVRVNYTSPLAAARARIQQHEATVCGSIVKCYFIQPASSRDETDDGTLHPPEPDKQFLISPPASPPVGWEPIRESEPIINFDLLTAIAQLVPGEAHELHRGRDSHPSIFVHVAEQTEEERRDAEQGKPRMRITQTRCPSR